MRPWVDPLTLKKIKIFGTDFLHHMKETIDESMIPEEYGGQRKNFSWEWPSNFEEVKLPEELEKEQIEEALKDGAVQLQAIDEEQT